MRALYYFRVCLALVLGLALLCALVSFPEEITALDRSADDAGPGSTLSTKDFPLVAEFTPPVVDFAPPWLPGEWVHVPPLPGIRNLEDVSLAPRSPPPSA